MADTDDDLRTEELEIVKSIYPDSLHLDPARYTGRVSIPILTDSGIPVCLVNLENHIIRSAQVCHLPPIEFKFELPKGYPYEAPPKIVVSSPVICEDKLSQLTLRLLQQWTDLQAQVLFAMIDELNAEAARPFELIGQEIRCEGIAFERIINHDKEQRQKMFDQATFSCEICQDEAKGADCVRFDQCGHVFCNVCLRDFFISLITNGDVEKIHCPDFECGKRFLQVREKYLRLDNISSDKFDFEEFKSQLMTPPITLLILQKILGDGEGTTLYNKYLTLFNSHQNAVIAKLFPARLVSCPREKCPAMIFREDMTSRLVICRTCDYAFCNNCRKSYHSDSIDCSKKASSDNYCGVPTEVLEKWLLSEKNSRDRDVLRYKYGFDLLTKVSLEYTMDKLFNEMLMDASQGFSKCPTCDLIIQRLDGCNKMKCSSCATLFCNLCGIYLDYDHPYDHFNTAGGTCYGKLFHGMPGVE